MEGRRRPDQVFGKEPDDPQPGDFWKYTNRQGKPLVNTSYRSNLTKTVWGIVTPLGQPATLQQHTVREHDDGMISILPGDGSSNSVKVEGPGEPGSSPVEWHGYVYHGVWLHV